MRAASPLHRLGLALGVLALLVGTRGAGAFLTPTDRRELDVSRFEVHDPTASYFDVAARRALLGTTDDPGLVQAAMRAELVTGCREVKSQPVLDGRIALPSFYDAPPQWRVAAEPLLAFEGAMSRLAGAWVASADPYFARCIVDVLESWAKSDALHDFEFSTARPQAWYAIESMIFSAALAYSTINGSVDVDRGRKHAIEAWLKRIAKHHFGKKGDLPSCCNNHFYRRALYMTIVGVVTDDDEMFRTGLRAPIAALHDLDERGALRLAMSRGWRAIHYQNYSLLYLVTIMQVAHRQGYDLFSLSVDGRSIADAVGFLMRSLAAPNSISGLPPGEQDLEFTNDPQYFSWMEIWLAHFRDPSIERFVRLYRPIFNRGAGGHLTLFFKRPETPAAAIAVQHQNLDTDRMSVAEVGARYPHLERWRRSR